MRPIEKSILEYFREYAAQCPDKRFLFDETRCYTVEEAYREAAAIGNRLYACGVRAGSAVALCCTRSLDTCLIYLALQMMGAMALLTDPHQSAEGFLRDAGARAEFLITNEAAGNGISANGDWEVSGHGPLGISYPASEEQPAFPPVKDLHAPATVVFTSGSTGKGKGVMLSQYNLVNHIRNFSVSGCYWETDVSAELLPVHHVFGLAVLLMGLIKRYCIFFPKTVDINYVAECVETQRITRLDGVPSFALALAEHHRKTHFCAESLRVGVLGGAPSTKAQFDFIEQELGIQLLPVYGQSECIGITGADETQSGWVRSSTVGKFLPMNEGFILDECGGAAPLGEEGEICVKGPAVMLGYLGDEKATREAIDGEGRLHTGDLGWLDRDGNLHISGRKKDIIIRNGVNIPAGKIEEALLQLEAVSQAAAVGVRHEKWGEVPCALVVLKDGRSLSEEAIKKALSEHLAKNEMPEKILFAQTLPLTPSGKPDKQNIREKIVIPDGDTGTGPAVLPVS